MEEKLFDLMTKMYTEFTERFDRVEGRLGNVERRLSRLDVAIENDIKRDIHMLYDGYKQTYEKLEEVDRKVDMLSSRIDKQVVEIKVIKGGKS